MTLPSEGRWVVRILSIRDLFFFGLYRREMKAIGYLGQMDKVFGVPVTTRSWSTVAAIVKVLRSEEV